MVNDYESHVEKQQKDIKQIPKNNSTPPQPPPKQIQNLNHKQSSEN